MLAEGGQALRADISNAGQGVDWHISVSQDNISVSKGQSYDVVFWAKSSAGQQISIGLQKQVDDWANYGLWRQVTLTSQWTKYSVSFEATVTASDSRGLFPSARPWARLAGTAYRSPNTQPTSFDAAFSKGLAVLEWHARSAKPSVWRWLCHAFPARKPRAPFLIVDDSSAAFSTTGAWQSCDYDSGDWTATGPFFHNWRPGCHELAAGTGDATFTLDIPADDTYSIDAWWAAAPGQASWTKQATFEVMVGDAVLATTTLDQSLAGDQWHGWPASPCAPPTILWCGSTTMGAGTLNADALLVQSTARYNDGSAAPSVELDAMDAIVLRRTGAEGCP